MDSSIGDYTDVAVLNILISAGADLIGQASGEATPLMTFALNGFVDGVRIILNRIRYPKDMRKALTMQDKNGVTPFTRINLVL